MNIAELQTLAKAATPGPWGKAFWPFPEPTFWIGQHDPDVVSSRMKSAVTGKVPREEDAAYIAACSPERILALCEVVGALGGLLDHYIQLVASGDCGFWNPEEEEPVIRVRAALAGLSEATE